MLLTYCVTLLAPGRLGSLSGQQIGPSAPFNSVTHYKHLHFFIQYSLCANCTVSPCRPCTWVSIDVKASYLVLVVILEGEDWDRGLLLWVTRVQCASLSVVSDIGPQFWNYLSISISAPLLLHSLLTVACNSATWCIRSSACAHLMQVFTFSPGEGSGHSLQPTTYTEVSFLLQLWFSWERMCSLFTLIYCFSTEITVFIHNETENLVQCFCWGRKLDKTYGKLNNKLLSWVLCQ